MEELKEKCGIVGIYGKNLPISRLVFFALFALQHRGQEASGITTSNGRKLFAHKNVEEIRKFLGATSLHFLSLDGLIKSIGLSEEHLSTSCFSGVYPIDLKERKDEVNYDVPKD